MTKPFSHTTGPRNAKIVLVGEAWGREEELTGLPFVGQSGQELTKMLREAGINRAKCLLTNVFNLRPQSNQIETLCGKKADVGKYYSLPPLRQGKYILPQYLPELDRLKEELTVVQPNLVIALGATALWALCQTAAIGSNRGAVTTSTLVPGQKVLATYHPASVLYNWAQRVICVPDFIKAEKESHFREIRRPKRSILVDPTLEEIDQWIDDETRGAQYCSVDIETGRGMIKCIGFSCRKDNALVIPFIDLGKDGGSYWRTPQMEQYAWGQVKQILEQRHTAKLFQNGLFDLQYIIRMGIRPRNCTQDTMLMSHALFPEMPKGLGFLGSVFTDEPAWKLMRTRQQEEFKRDE